MNVKVLQPSDEVRVGERVRIRRQRWLVVNVCTFADCQTVTLSGLDTENLRAEQQVLLPFERVERIPTEPHLHIVSRGKWRRACRSLLADNGGAGVLRTARTAQIDLLAHQLEPALAVVRGLGSRVLIADEVGLGKTIQAGLVISELRARGAAPRVLILAPAGLREQWRDELSTRFGLRFALLDMQDVKRRKALLPIAVNPWSTEPMVVASVDYVKRPEVFPAVQSSRWDAIVVDEAHGVAIGTDRHEAVRELCAAAPVVLLLTATPHSGDVAAFRSLCGIGEHGDELVAFRRSRQEIGLHCKRRVHQLRVHPSDAESRMYTCLRRFEAAVRREHGNAETNVSLALSTLRKRALSSAHSLAESVRRRLAAIVDANAGSMRQLSLPLVDPAGELDARDDAPRWEVPALSNVGRERRLLALLLTAAEAAAPNETKLMAIRRLLRRIREPVIVFTEYRDTLAHVRDVVAPRAAVIHGGLSRDERRAALARFNRGDVLLATDAAGEGLNLQHACRVVVNLELPWNPTRLEQRIGRVDRIGQRRQVHVFHLIAHGTSEVGVLDRLVARVARARTDIGAPDPLGSSAETATVPGSLNLCRLHDEAAAECQRLQTARRIGGHWDTSPAASSALARGPMLMFSKRHVVRARLKSRALVLFQSTARDVAGRLVGSHLTSALVRTCARHWWQLRYLDELAALVDDSKQSAWLEDTVRAHAAFWRTRLERERAIAQHLDQDRATALQLALFEPRVDWEQRLEPERQDSVLLDHQRRVIAAEEASALSVCFLTPTLVLVP